MEDLHEKDGTFDVIPNHLGTVKRRRSVQVLSKPQPYDAPPAKFAPGHSNDRDQSIAHSTEPQPLAEDSPRVVPSPPAVVESLEHSMLQKPTAELLDEILHLHHSVFECLNRAAKIKNTPFLSSLLLQVCNVSGIVLLLKDLSQNETSEDPWNVNMATLCAPSGPLQDLVLKLRTLVQRLAPERSSSCQEEGPGRLVRDVFLTEIRSSFETQKKILLYALHNEPRFAGILINE